MRVARARKSDKYVFPVVIGVAILGGILGGVTGISILYGLGMLGLVGVLAAASYSSYKAKREAHTDDSNETRAREAGDQRP